MKKKVFILVCLCICSQLVSAGSLEPSALPAPTMKTLDQVEPRIPIAASSTAISTLTINKSGSYYFTGDRTATGNGISVDANNVTIDLMGYSLIGTSNTGAGIVINGKRNVQIRNGTVRNFGYHGIAEYNGNKAEGHTIINIRTIDNGSYGTGYVGISMIGQGHLVKNCVSTGNDQGITTGSSCTVTGNVVFKNSEFGIYAGSGSTVTNNTVYNNDTSASGSPIYGIYAGSGSTVSGNIVTSNGNLATAFFYGIFTGSGCTISGNSIYSNGNSAVSGYALSAGSGSTVIGNTVNSNGISATGTIYGIYLTGNNLVDRNTAYNNTGTNMNHPSNCAYGTNYAP
jgi:parallel beta-helix repeat protein